MLIVTGVGMFDLDSYLHAVCGKQGGQGMVRLSSSACFVALTLRNR